MTARTVGGTTPRPVRKDASCRIPDTRSTTLPGRRRASSSALIGSCSMLRAGEEGQAEKYHFAVGLGKDLMIQLALFGAVQDDEIEPILESLKCRAHGGC